MNPDKPDEELPEWVKLVNRLLHGPRKCNEEKNIFDRSGQV
jgi:hypothetical protein